MPQQFLNRLDMCAILEQMRGKRMPQAMRSDMRRDPGLASRIRQHHLDAITVHMATGYPPRPGIDTEFW